MSTMLFYNKIVPLNAEQHGKLKLRQSEGDAGFAARANWVPLAGTEFFQASRDFPVIFSGQGEDLVPVALLGLSERQNLFIDKKGHWEAGVYVPAFVRRYPFVLAHGEEGETSEQLTVCIDESWKGFNDKDGQALFKDGEQSDFLTEIVEFLQLFHGEMLRTRRFTARLRELDLLVRKDLQLQDARGRSYIIQDFQVVDEERLDGLEDAQLIELQRSGFLAWIHAHLISLGNTTRLQRRLPA
ncbi:SapC family protein [Alkalilimnicola sp. S0819]|uniref:SapC family protein n=1 Tax=Alkalilimnicola sp. S0819 TaxID=2613922 RepID=UPI00126291F1|nr:SapC family protein [Alkalilimnicola sp. S0819]KAB7623812.1 SapC family protein [Alkalilimnicola sp. S0819]MPQ16686.1 SapC family protein [Alkalilimnicola sp. S0819]